MTYLSFRPLLRYEAVLATYDTQSTKSRILEYLQHVHSVKFVTTTRPTRIAFGTSLLVGYVLLTA